MAQIGAESQWQETNDDVYSNFADTGDWMRNSRPNLETVIDAGVRTIIYDGDAVRINFASPTVAGTYFIACPGLYSELRWRGSYGRQSADKVQ